MTDFATPTYRPMIAASNYVAASGHYLASHAAMRILQQGGNAIDAGVAAGICINVTQPDLTNLGGVAPMIIYLAASQEVVTISGLGRWPKKARLEYFRDEVGKIPLGVQNAITPSACDAWLTALARFGTMRLADVLEPAHRAGDRGLSGQPAVLPYADRGAREPSAMADLARVYAAGWHAVIRPATSCGSRSWRGRSGCCATRSAARRSLGRAGAIMAARDVFYKGELAERMARFSQEQGGFLDYDDLAEFSVKVEAPAKTSYRGYEIYSCGPWCQGPVVPQTMNILENFDLAGFGHNSPEALHAIIEALKASFADRHAFYGDPDFVDVPIDGLLDKAYAAEWAARIDRRRAWPDMPEPGDPWRFSAAQSRMQARRPEPVSGPPGFGHVLSLRGGQGGQRASPPRPATACATRRWCRGWGWCCRRAGFPKLARSVASLVARSRASGRG